MLKEIHLAGSLGRCSAAFAALSPMSRQSRSAKTAVERSGVKPEDVKELLVGTSSAAPSAQPPARQIEIGEDQMDFTILIKLLPLFGFTYFVVLPVSLAYIVKWIIHYWFR